MKKNKTNTTKLLETLESQLKSHDWFYEYSDDHRYYNSGLREFTQIWQTIEQLQDISENAFDQAIAMYKEHKPVVTTPNEVRITN